MKVHYGPLTVVGAKLSSPTYWNWWEDYIFHGREISLQPENVGIEQVKRRDK